MNCLKCFYEENLRLLVKNLLTEVSFVIFRLLNISTEIITSSEKIYYEVPEGFLINFILRNKISEEDRYIFEELTNASLRKILQYCYGCTFQYCWGQDDCYHCTIILFINEEMRKTMGTFTKFLIKEENLVDLTRVNIIELGGKNIITCNFSLFRINISTKKYVVYCSCLQFSV